MSPEFDLKLTHAILGRRLNASDEVESVAGYYRFGLKSSSTLSPPSGRAWITTDKGKEYEVDLDDLKTHSEAAA